jgi:hypothetical protein
MGPSRDIIKKVLIKVCLYLLFFSFFNYIGCYSSKRVGNSILHLKDRTELTSNFVVTTYDDESIEVDWDTFNVIDDTLYAKGIVQNVNTYFGQPTDVTLAISDIKYIEIDEYDEIATAGCVIGSAGLIILIIGAIASVDRTPRKCEVGK